MVVQVLLTLENEGWNKHVESAWFPCADEGSTPSSSTYVTPSRGLTLVRVLLVASLCKSGRAERDSLQLHLRYALARSHPREGSFLQFPVTKGLADLHDVVVALGDAFVKQRLTFLYDGLGERV